MALFEKEGKPQRRIFFGFIETEALLQKQTRLAELEEDGADDPNHPDFEEYEELRPPYPWEIED